MINRSHFDALFADKFFSAPSTKKTVNIAFPLPVNRTTISEFMKSPAGLRFQAGVRQTASVLKKWCQQHQIDPACIDHFMHNFTHNYSHDVAFDLYKNGIPLLVEIANLIQSDRYSIDVYVATIKNLLPDLAVCAPGAYKAIYSAYLKLAVDPVSMLMDIRKELSEQIILELIKIYNEKLSDHPDHEFYKIAEGNITHYVNKVLNYFAQSLGIEAIRDDLEPTDDNHAVSMIIPEFQRRIVTLMSLDAVIEGVLNKIDISEFKLKFANEPGKILEHYASLQQALVLFGPDDSFTPNILFDEDAIEQNQYVFNSEADDHLSATILARLANSGYIDLSKCRTHFTIEDAQVYLPRSPLVKNGLVKTKDGRVYSLIPYLIDQLNDEKTDLFPVLKICCEDVILECRKLLLHQNTSIARLGKIYQAIKKLQAYQGQPHQSFYDFVGESDFNQYVTSIHRLERFLQLVDDNERLHLILHLPREKLTQIFSSQENPINIVKCLPQQDVIKFVLVAHERNLLSPIINDMDKLKILLTLLPITDFNLFFSYVLYKSASASLDFSIDKVLALFKTLEEEKAVWFFKFIGSHYWKEFTANCDVLKAILSAVSPSMFTVIIDMLTRDYLDVIIASFDNFIDLLSDFDSEKRIHLLMSLGTKYLQKHINDWHKAGLVISMLDPSCYSVFLNLLTNNNIQHIIRSHADLNALLDHLPLTARMGCLQQIGSCALHHFLSQDKSIVDVLLRLSPNDYLPFFELLGAYHLLRYYPDYQTLSNILKVLPEKNGPDFMRAFALVMPSSSVLARYRAKDDTVYQALLHYRDLDRVALPQQASGATTYSGSFFNHLMAHRTSQLVSATPPVLATKHVREGYQS